MASEQTEALWRFLEERLTASGRAQYGLAPILWYGGALIVISAMGLFSTTGFSRYGGGFLLATALIYGLVFAGAGVALWRRSGPLHILGGLLVTVAVTMAPLATYAVQDLMNWWGTVPPGDYRAFYIWVKQGWVPMDLATVVVGTAALSIIRFPFLVMPIAVALLFLSQDLAHWVAGEGHWEHYRQVMMAFGLGVLAIAWAIDVRAKKDFAFWLHLFGLFSFWGGLTSLDSHSELGRLGYAALNIVLIGFSVFLDRRAYAAFGAFGVALYLGHLAESVFKDSLMFPFVLSLIGVAIIAFGVGVLRWTAALQAWMQRYLPAGIHALRPAHARAE